MRAFLEGVMRVSDVLWHDAALWVLLATGVLFTLWSGFSQFRALTHGTAVLRGRYDDAHDPGAITHFQALSAALSATVGLGNIAGVAIAISVGGPGALFWMWVTGFIGMALKLTEVTQAMLYRDVTDPQRPHGGAMWVVRDGLARFHPRLRPVGQAIGGIFCVTVLISAITGGNMFQAWNVAEISQSYFGWPKLASGVVMTVFVALVILGGIRRIGAVAERLVPFMCLAYLLAGLVVIAFEIERVPDILRSVVRGAFAPSEATGAFLGGSVGWAFLKGMQRALFSNEAGQGSAPMAHSAARTEEPVREGVVAGLEPFIDTICVCTVTAVVILLSGVWNRAPSHELPSDTRVVAAAADGASDGESWTLDRGSISPLGTNGHALRPGEDVFAIVIADPDPRSGSPHRRITGVVREEGDGLFVDWATLRSTTTPRLAQRGVFADYKGATLTARGFDSAVPGLGSWVVPATVWLFALSTIISWSYYGEQAVVFLLGVRWVLVYRAVYCALVLLAASPLISTQEELDHLSALGTGVMLWANVPIMLVFGRQAMRAYHDYIRRLKAGAFDRSRGGGATGTTRRDGGRVAR